MKTQAKHASGDRAVSGAPVAKRSLFARYGMLVCWVAMTLSIAGYLLSGGTSGGLLDDLALVVPLLACVGMHFVLHRLPGRSCHGGHDGRNTPAPRSEASRKPGDAPSHWTDVIHIDRPGPAAPSPPRNAAGRSKVPSRGSGKGLQE